ncbi:MAG: hypothetical protein AB1921_13755 [Thermodesulfobacteriota bacterium]
MRPVKNTYFAFLAFPTATFLIACYSLSRFMDLFSLVSAAFLLAVIIAVVLGLKKSYIKTDSHTLTVRNFFAKPNIIGLSSIMAVKKRQNPSSIPASLKIRVDQGDSRQKMVTIPIKWYARKDAGFLLSLLNLE